MLVSLSTNNKHIKLAVNNLGVRLTNVLHFSQRTDGLSFCGAAKILCVNLV